jgi:rare lipoprotein A (peptidoglycan hydrolase)
MNEIIGFIPIFEKKEQNKENIFYFIFGILIIASLIHSAFTIYNKFQATKNCVPWIKPISDIQAKEKEIKPTEVEVTKSTIKGIASYYSKNGCIGCRKDLKMANGEPLDDAKLTVAYNKAKLNSFVKITNLKNNKSVIAKVTDRGGFEKLGRIIDLTVATKNYINCSDLCNVEVEIL